MERRFSTNYSALEELTPWDGRRTRAIVDLDLLRSNVRTLRGMIGDAAMMTVVKGNAYGHGSLIVARTALEAGATWIGVFTVEEGIELRRGGIDAPILILGPFSPAEAKRILAYNLTPTIHSEAAGQAFQNMSEGRIINFHVEIDTGMTRGGIWPSEATRLLTRLSSLPALHLQGVFTHFADAGQPDEPTAVDQLTIFRDTVAAIEAAGFAIPCKHAANSAATLHFPSAFFDMVRIGIGTYGYYPSERRTGPRLEPILTLLSEVVRVSRVPAGTGIGYGHAFRCSRPSTIALVPVGYADGLHRSLGEGRGTVLIGGSRAPIVGRISMDQITVDVTDIPWVESGDEVVLIGRQAEQVQTADTLAHQAGTISYEVLTALLPRVPRLYVQAGRSVCVNLGGEYLDWNDATSEGARVSL